MRYANIIYNDTVNVDSGVALTVYAQGCPHKCEGCFSQQTWDFKGGKEWTKQDENNLIYCLENYKYDWLVLLGGEPMCNLDFCQYFIDITKKYQKNIKVWCYTGFEFDKVKDLNIMEYIDVIKCGKFIKKLHDARLKYYGSANQKLYRRENGVWLEIIE